MVCERWCVKDGWQRWCVRDGVWKMGCERGCVTGGREAGGGAPGIQNQKQEPHTKLWGINGIQDWISNRFCSFVLTQNPLAFSSIWCYGFGTRGKSKMPTESNGSNTLAHKLHGNCKKDRRSRLNFAHAWMCATKLPSFTQSSMHSHIWLRVVDLRGPIALHVLRTFSAQLCPSLLK